MWQSGDEAGPGQDGSAYGVFAQLFDSEGFPVGTELQVNTFTRGIQSAPSVAMDADGDFVVAWQSGSFAVGQDGSYGGVFAQRFSQDAGRTGPEFQVNTFTANDQGAPSLGIDADGDVVVAWTSFGQVGYTFGVYAQRFSAAGALQGGEFQVPETSAGSQFAPAVAMDPDGDFVATWVSYGQDGDGDGIYAQRFAISPVANEDDATPPATLALDAVFPNPIRDAATLRYALPTTAAVRLTVTDVLGRTVLTRAEGMQPAGEHEARLALDDLPSGVYVVRLEADGATAMQRVTVVR